MKEKMQEWAKQNWVNLDPKTAQSLINRVIAVIEKDPSTLKGALHGLTQSLNALANNEKTPETSTLEVWFISEFIANILMPVADSIDASVKEKGKPAKRKEYWADTQEEAQALREADEAEAPAPKPRKARVGSTPALEAINTAEVIQALAMLKSAGLIK